MYKSKREKIFLNCQFTELTQKGKLISIGLVHESGKSFYADFNDFFNSIEEKLNLPIFIRNTVLKFMTNQEKFNNLYKIYDCEIKNGNYNVIGDTLYITEILKKWLSQFGEVEIWSDCLAYNSVIFNELFGGSCNLPNNIYYIPFDINILFNIYGFDPDINRAKFIGRNDLVGNYNALIKAKVIKECYEKLTKSTTTVEESTCKKCCEKDSVIKSCDECKCETKILTIGEQLINNLCETDLVITHESENDYKYNAPHNYKIKKLENNKFTIISKINFQCGPIKEVGVNGVTDEILLSIVLERLNAFQDSEFKNIETDKAIEKLEEALLWLYKRKLDRKIRNVEGTNKI